MRNGKTLRGMDGTEEDWCATEVTCSGKRRERVREGQRERSTALLLDAVGPLPI